MQTTTQAHIVRFVPTIKGIFVNSHIEAVRRRLGSAGVDELERRFGAPLAFRAGQDVPVADEVRLIELALDLVHDVPLEANERAFEAGRLHFRNFTTTPYARVLFTLFPRNFHFMMLHAKTVAERVFKGVQFRVEDLGPHALLLTMENADYPLEHFQGLFQEWMDFFEVQGSVHATVHPDGRFEYRMEWTL
jgi:uncharacterized protein (TIGR02265 family)